MKEQPDKNTLYSTSLMGGGGYFLSGMFLMRKATYSALQQNWPGVPPGFEIPLCHNTCYVWSHDLVVSQPILTIFSALESTGSLLSKIPKIVEIGSETKSYDSKRMLLSQSGISTPGEPRPILLRGRVHFMVYCLQSFENDRSKL